MRRFLLVGALCAILGLTAAACKRPVPAPAPAPPPPAAPAPPPPPPPQPAPPPSPPPAALTEDQIFAKKTVDQLNAERVLADVLFDYDSSVLRDDGRAAASRNADYLKRWPSVRDHGGRACRHARHIGIQPCARRKAGSRGQGLHRQPRCAGRSDRSSQQGQGTTGVHGRKRGVLAAQ